MYYANMIALDEKTEHEMWRDRIEYLARFWNNEGVDQVQRSREARRGQTDESFDEFLNEQFGRQLGGVREPSLEEMGRDIDSNAATEQYDVIKVVEDDGEVREEISSFSPRHMNVARKQADALRRAEQQR